MKIYLSTGEISGEQHAARFVTALKELRPDIEIDSMGGGLLEAAGARIIVPSEKIRVMGFVEVITHLPSIRKAFKQAVRHIVETKPDAVVLVDYPGFHLRLAAEVKKRCPEIPVVQYIAPKVWAWNEGRVKKIRETIDLILSIFPFEEQWFADREVRAAYVGNPVCDAVKNANGQALRAELEIDPQDKLIAIFPGSRRKEIRAILPPMLEAGMQLESRHEGLAFAVAAAPGYSRKDLEALVPIPAPLPVVENRNFELLAASDAVMAKSGTTTLEAALLKKPMVVAYKGSALSAMIARRVVKLKHFSLPNIVMQNGIVTELFQQDVTGTGIADEVSRLLYDAQYRGSQLREFDVLERKLGDEPAAIRAAKGLLDFLGTPYFGSDAR